MIERLAILGVGLLGGSVARAARRTGLAHEIVGVGRDPRRLEAAVADGTLDRVTVDVADGVRGADLVVLAAPVLANERVLEVVWTAADDDALVTDVGSTKAGIARTAERLQAGRPLAFVGSHPMAGSEQSGYSAGRADLFQGALVIVTPADGTPTRAVKGVTAFWEAIGARVATLDPHTHDRVVAAISHLPHLVAVALVDGATRFESGAMDFAGRGFKDTTRIAAGDPAVWEEIFSANRTALLASLDAFRVALDDLVACIRAGDANGVRETLGRVKRAREAVR
jgi:prephenate dehydrogenase